MAYNTTSTTSHVEYTISKIAGEPAELVWICRECNTADTERFASLERAHARGRLVSRMHRSPAQDTL